MGICDACVKKTPLLPQCAWIESLLSLHNSSKSTVDLDESRFVFDPSHALSVHDEYGIKQAWHRGRRAFALNGSSMPTICGNNFFQSATDLAISRALDSGDHRMRYYKDPDKCPFPVKPVFRRRYDAFLENVGRGNALEPMAKQAFCDETGHALIPVSDRLIFGNRTVFDGQLGVTPDGITYCGKILEVKCPSKRPIPSRAKAYFDQIQANMHVIGCDGGWLYQYHKEKHLVTPIALDAAWVRDSQPFVDAYLLECVRWETVFRGSLFNIYI